MIVLHTEAIVNAPAARCFDLARSIDAHQASATMIRGKAVGGKLSGLAGAGDETQWSAQFFGVRFKLTTRIERYNRPCCFSDVMSAGLFRHFGHVYTFEPLGPHQTRLVDEFSFESPFGPIGSLLDQALLRSKMQTVAEARVAFLKQTLETEAWRQFLGDAPPDESAAA